MKLVIVTLLELDLNLAFGIKVDDLIKERCILNQLLLFEVEQVLPLFQAHLENVFLVFVVVFKALFVADEVPDVIFVIYKGKCIAYFLLHSVFPLQNFSSLFLFFLFSSFLLLLNQI